MWTSISLEAVWNQRTCTLWTLSQAQHILEYTFPLCLAPSDGLHIIPFQLFKMEVLNWTSQARLWTNIGTNYELRDESWGAKLSYWHDFQKIVWEIFPPHAPRISSELLSSAGSCLPAKFLTFSRGTPRGPVHLYLSFLSEQMKLESFNNITPVTH